MSATYWRAGLSPATSVTSPWPAITIALAGSARTTLSRRRGSPSASRRRGCRSRGRTLLNSRSPIVHHVGLPNRRPRRRRCGPAACARPGSSAADVDPQLGVEGHDRGRDLSTLTLLAASSICVSRSTVCWLPAFRASFDAGRGLPDDVLRVREHPLAHVVVGDDSRDRPEAVVASTWSPWWWVFTR